MNRGQSRRTRYVLCMKRSIHYIVYIMYNYGLISRKLSLSERTNTFILSAHVTNISSQGRIGWGRGSKLLPEYFSIYFILH